jgi:hypothetical protein
MKKLVAVVLWTAALAVSVPTVASAHGPCGKDFAAAHACGVSSPASLRGSLTAATEHDWYVFRAVKGTALRITITDTESPACTESEVVACGDVSAQLMTSAKRKVASTGASEPYAERAVSERLTHRLGKTGTYYIVVSGHLGQDGNGIMGPGTPIFPTYSLVVKASPKVQRPR